MPGLNQCFSRGERVFLSEADKPAPDADRLLQEWQVRQYQMQYGSWTGEGPGQGAGGEKMEDGGGGSSASAHTQVTAEGLEARAGTARHPHASARGGRTHVLGHGASIGRSKSCALFIARSALRCVSQDAHGGLRR